MTDYGYELLAIAILNRAVEDYRILRRQLSKGYLSESEILYNEHQLWELEEFFLSEYGNLMAHGLGADIVQRLQTEQED